MKNCVENGYIKTLLDNLYWYDVNSKKFFDKKRRKEPFNGRYIKSSLDKINLLAPNNEDNK